MSLANLSAAKRALFKNLLQRVIVSLEKDQSVAPGALTRQPQRNDVFLTPEFSAQC